MGGNLDGCRRHGALGLLLVLLLLLFLLMPLLTGMLHVIQGRPLEDRLPLHCICLSFFACWVDASSTPPAPPVAHRERRAAGLSLKGSVRTGPMGIWRRSDGPPGSLRS